MYTKEAVVLSFTLIVLFLMQTLSTSAVNYHHIGCFKDNASRAMPKLLGNWRHGSKAVEKCALATQKAGYSVFGVQFAGECWSGPQAYMTYKKYGTSNRCVNGRGGSWVQDVYDIVNASLIANYDVKRCYEVDITFHYKIPGGLTLNTIADTKNEFSNIFNTLSNLLKVPQFVPQCSGVIITIEEITASPPGVTSVFFRVPVIFTAADGVPDNQVSSKLTNCINVATSNQYKGLLDSNTPTITESNVTYNKYNLSSISEKRSCCGGDIPPPCCAAGSIKVSSTKCGCVAGFKFVPGSFCVRCPSDTYQDKQGQTSCANCPANEQTFGKTAMTSKSNCSDTNPLQLRGLKVYLPFDIKSGTVVANVTVTGQLASLVQPFIFYISNVTQRGKQSPGSFKRRRRRDIVDVCEEAGTIVPLNYFCIQRLSGQIKVTQDFVFKDGDEFDLKIRVTDSDQWGKTENLANFKFISRDECKDIREIYEEAVKFCSAVSLANGQKSCPSAQCLVPLYKWREAVHASEKFRADCASDPKNMDAVIQQYSSCIGPPNVTLDPVSQELTENAPAVLTCNASSPLQVNITWYKNGKPIGRTGSQLKIDKFQHEDQGDYHCSFSTLVTSSLSKPALLVMKDVFTSRVSFRIVNEKFKDDLLDPSSSSYSDMQITIQLNLENYLNSGNSAWSYEVKLVQFRDSSGKVGVDLVVYSSAKSEDFASYYSRLEALLADESAMGNALKPSQVSRKSVTVRSATHCLPKKTGKESIMGIFDWPVTVIGQKSSSVKCPYGPQAASATRPCGGNFGIGGVWGNPDVKDCKYKSERTNKLNNLAKTPIDKQNVVKVTKDVKNLTSKPDDMNEADAVLIADVIGNVVSLDDSLNETAQDVVDVIDNVMKMKKEDLQESQRSSKASTKFLQALDKVATNLPLSDEESSRRLVAPSVAIQSNRVDPGSFPGMSLAVKSSAADPNKLTPDSMVSGKLPMAGVQTSITLPEVMFEKESPSERTVKIGFVIYQNDKFFQPVIPDEEESEQELASVMSRVISSSVQDMKFNNLSKPVELVFEPAIEVDEESGKSVCVFWDFSAMGGLGNWSDRGCKFMKNEAGRVKCHCDHMTNFAVLFSASGPKRHDERNAMALSIISYVGCAISLVGLTLTLMTYALFRNLRKTNQQPILMSLCVALMLLLIVFIAGAAQTENLIGCRIVAVLLHFFALATVMWMGVEGYNMYMSFVQVMATYQSKFMLKASAVAWGVPAFIVIITIASATSYYGNEDVCVLYGVPFQAAQFAPILLIILINFVIFILAIRALNRTGALVSAEKKSTSYHRVRTATAILILLGLTWAFGALAVSRAQLVFDYLFCIFNSFQGFFIFYFHCIRHQEVRNQWKWLLLGKGPRVRKTETDSRTGYPKTASRQNHYEVGTPSTSLSMRVPPGRKETVTSTVDGGSLSFKPRPDVIPAEV